MLCFSIGLGVTHAAAGGVPGISHYAASYFMGDHPLAIRALVELPPPLRQKIEEHLRARLGPEFYGHLKFRGGRRRDPATPGEAPDARAVFYELNYSFSRPEAGIAEYVALLALGADGSVLAEIDLPAFQGSADAHRIVPLRQAKDIADRSGFSGPGIDIDLDYSREHDCLRWRFRRFIGPEPGQQHYRALYVLMLDRPVVEIHDEYDIL